MTLKAAFIFLAGGANSATARAVVSTPGVDLTVVGAKDYADAEGVARDLVADGIVAIELCGGFGTAGTARIAQAVAGKAAVGVVRFDIHPGLDGKSGDSLFGEPAFGRHPPPGRRPRQCGGSNGQFPFGSGAPRRAEL